jgi:gamma-glutamyltranspeptidase / glutathione hydrolase
MRPSSPVPSIRLEQGCVVSYCPVATAVGAGVLRRGGNAVDAAIATAFALSVTYPQAGNIGGGGFALVFMANGGVHCLDYRETAPAKVRRDLLVDGSGQLGDRSTSGALAVGTPGTVAGMAALRERFGTWSWDRLLEPAIEIADCGNWLTVRQAAYLEMYEDSLKRYESTRKWLTRTGVTPLPGARFVQAELAKTLRAIASEGPAPFYRGRIAELLVAEIERGGGLLDAEDLAAYEAKWRPVFRRSFCGRDVYSVPFPSAGGLIAQLSLGMMEAEGGLDLPPDSAERLALLARVFRLAFALRRNLAGDPDDLKESELAEVRGWAERKFQRGDLERLEKELEPLLLSTAGGVRDSLRTSTTHFCVLDSKGNAVSNTCSLNTIFGAKLVVDGAGFLLNNCLDDFEFEAATPNWYDLVHGPRNLIHGRRRPVSSMSPTLTVNGGKVELIVGGSGGSRIPTMVTQVACNVLCDSMPLELAIRTARIHHQGSPPVLVAERRLAAGVVRQLVAAGHQVESWPALGICAAIMRDASNDEVSSTLDQRFMVE